MPRSAAVFPPLLPRAVILLALGLMGCGRPVAAQPDAGPAVVLPEGVACSRVDQVSSASELVQALGAAASGACVVVNPGSYDGGFTVPSGVALIAQSRGQALFVNTDPARSALALAGGVGSGIYGVTVTASAGNGIAVEGAPATLSRVLVRGSRAGVAAKCAASAGCAGTVTLSESTLEENANGLTLSGIAGSVERSSIRGSRGANLSDGNGVIVAGGAKLEATALVLEDNALSGLLLDGRAGRTTARLTGVTVRRNNGVGVWAQALAGTVADPWLTIAGSVLEANSMDGVRLIGAKGVTLTTTAVRATQQVPVPVSITQTAWVGDGVAILSGSGEVRLDDVTLEGNARCQALIDDGRENISIVNSHVSTDGGLYLVVVQNSQAVNVPPALLSDAGVDPLKP